MVASKMGREGAMSEHGCWFGFRGGEPSEVSGSLTKEKIKEDRKETM